MNFKKIGICVALYGSSLFASDGDVPRDLSGKEEALRARSRERRARMSEQSAAQAVVVAALLHTEVAKESEGQLSSAAAAAAPSRRARGFDAFSAHGVVIGSSSGHRLLAEGQAGKKRGRAESCDSEELKELAKQQVPDKDISERDSKRAITEAPRLDGRSGMSTRLSDLDLAAQGSKPVDPTEPLIVTFNRLVPGKNNK